MPFSGVAQAFVQPSGLRGACRPPAMGVGGQQTHLFSPGPPHNPASLLLSVLIHQEDC